MMIAMNTGELQNTAIVRARTGSRPQGLYDNGKERKALTLEEKNS